MLAPSSAPAVIDYMDNVASNMRYTDTTYFHRIVRNRARASDDTDWTPLYSVMDRSQFAEPPPGVKEVLQLQPYQVLPPKTETALNAERTAAQRHLIHKHLMVRYLARLAVLMNAGVWTAEFFSPAGAGP